MVGITIKVSEIVRDRLKSIVNMKTEKACRNVTQTEVLTEWVNNDWKRLVKKEKK